MQTCIQLATVKQRNFDNTILSLRLTSAEAVRFWRVMDTAKERQPYAGKSDIYRELIGMTPPRILTRAEIEFFRTGHKEADLSQGVALAPRGKGIPHQGTAALPKVQGVKKKA